MRSACDVLDWDPSHRQRIGNQRPMATPGHSLGAHDRGPFTRCRLNQLLYACFECRGLHVIGVPAERGVAPARVGRVPPSVTKPPELRHMRIADTGLSKWSWKRLVIELRVITRARDGPHIYKALHAVSEQEVEEGFQRPGGMPYGQDCRWLFRGTRAHSNRQASSRRPNNNLPLDSTSNANCNVSGELGHLIGRWPIRISAFVSPFA